MSTFYLKTHTKFSTLIVIDFDLSHTDFFVVFDLKGLFLNSNLEVQAYVLKLRLVCVSV